MSAMTYKKAGVDIDAGEELVERIKPHVASTMRPEVLAGLGGFSALISIPAGMKEPILVSGTDGVGTKLKLAFETGDHSTIGIDLVAMCVNDVLVCGAAPLFFLDYYACSKLDPAAGAQVIAGIAAGCREAGCALVGGETAELPGFYQPGEYDLAGFAVGVVERGRILTGDRVRPGDAVIGLASTGVHSNGFSLVRAIISERRAGLGDPFPGSDEPLGRALLRPTRIYVKPVLALIERVDVRALAHITGGGLMENIPRTLPDGLGVRLDRPWPLPPIFRWLAEQGEVPRNEMHRTFNMGLGMTAVVPAASADEAVAFLAANGVPAQPVGNVVEVAGDGPRVTVEAGI